MNIKSFSKIIRRPEVLNKTGWSKSTLYNRINDGLFPTPISLGVRAVGFVESECNEVIQSMIAGYTEQQLRALVQNIIDKRSYKG
ncbi:AlpA family transcriptional regulator [Pseudoalteromonas sp. Hal273]